MIQTMDESITGILKDAGGYQGSLKEDVFCHRKPCVTIGVTDVELQHHEQDNGSGVTH